MADDRKPIIDSDCGSAYGATPYQAAPVSPYHGYNAPPQAAGAVPHPRTPQHAPPPPVGLPLGGASVVVPGAPPAGFASPVSPAPHIGPYPPGVQPAAVSPPGVDSPTYTGPTSTDIVQDDPNAKTPSATAPPIELMDHISGYDNVTFDSSLLPPPTYDEAQSMSQEGRSPLTNVPVITEEEAREALLQFVGEHCCYGISAAQDMVFRNLQSTSAFHYSLESFGESRSTAWKYEPYRGQPVDSAMNGLAPGPWQVIVPYPEKFKNGDHRVEVPHTASIKPCHTCSGRGRTRCSRCSGWGKVKCDSCNGAGETHRIGNGSHQGGHFGDGGHGSHGHGGHMGHDGLGDGHMRGSPHHHGHHRHHHTHHHHEQEYEACNWCNGTGKKRCTRCHGHGDVGCKTCEEAANLKCFIQLTVTWTNHYDDFIVEKTELPDKLIRKVTGQTALDEENQRVWPIIQFPDQAINQASKRLIQKHGTAFPTENILVQRQRVRIVPVTEVVYEWKEKTKRFFVYGFEHKVYAPDYPQKCCCGCCIL